MYDSESSSDSSDSSDNLEEDENIDVLLDLQLLPSLQHAGAADVGERIVAMLTDVLVEEVIEEDEDAQLIIVFLSKVGGLLGFIDGHSQLWHTEYGLSENEFNNLDGIKTRICIETLASWQTNFAIASCLMQIIQRALYIYLF